jgi:uncharacterized LabA/DUF88 family protein
MNKFFLAIFIDLENVADSEFNLDDLIKALILEDEHSQQGNGSDKSFVFAIKEAYGSMNSIPKSLKTQLTEHNFSLHDTPHIARKKNRSDLFISIDAFETLYLNSPSIDRYIFLTSDSDFTVISDKLRKFGKEVWLVCRKADEARKLLATACDKLLFLEDYQLENKKIKKGQKKIVDVSENDIAATELFKEILKTLDLDKLPCNLSVISDRMKRIDPGFDIKRTSFKRFIKLAQQFKDQGIVKIEIAGRGLSRLVDVDVSKIE